ncbi:MULTISPECIES: DNA topoisomerase IB [unclassified Brevundimonas]|uniref:DNA topoisomerase IB n=1 Tax=unclassified Brevundimonas TaxID=2622653 RepID=UPI00289B2A8D|nr:DNA topoisomerase IB [Brevundimonas sp.]
MTEDLPAGLRWCSDEIEGIRRKRAGRGFCYLDPDGTRVTDEKVLARIRALAIPPAWTQVWICPHRNGHIQATGRDARGRKQYRYHPNWITAQSENKFARMPAFAAALPRLEAAIETGLARRKFDQEKVVATAMRLMELSLIRVGNARYSRENSSFGLTTLRKRHIEVSGTELRLRFRGKSGIVHDLNVQDRRLATGVRRLSELPGQTLFQYEDDEGQFHAVTSDDINAFIREHMGGDFSAKDFRTWAATVCVARALCDTDPPTSAADAKRKANTCIREAASLLGNTLAVCRSAYVHPRVIDMFERGEIAEALPRTSAKSFERALAKALAVDG